MSPFSELLHSLRLRHDLRQADLAERIGYEQSYISALEIGLKGPPTQDFLARITAAMSLSETEQQELHAAAQASQRKLVIDPDAPPDIYWLLNDLRDEVQNLTSIQVRMIRDVLALRSAMRESRPQHHRIKRRYREEAPM